MKTSKKPLVILLLYCLLFTSCIIQNPRPENCVEVKTTITNIKEGSTFDIVFFDSSDRYYINRGVEKGLNLDSLNTKVLNKTVTLHLAKIIGNVTTEHIVQLVVEEDTIYSEFPDYVRKQKHK